MDYLEFFTLKEYPFSNAVDTKFYYNSEQHSDAIVRIKYAIDTMKGLAVVIGDIGTGKTTLARRILDELSEDKYEAALLVVLHSSVTADWITKKIATQIGVDNPASTKMEMLGQIYRRLLEIHERGQKTAVIIDEAQMLGSKEIMEEFRGLLNMEASGGKLITFILFGMPELEEILSLDEPLKQRIAVRCRMRSFEEEVTKEYILHRLKIAGCEKEIFQIDSIHAINRYARGIPRLINTVCDNALLEGYLLKKEIIGSEIIESVVIGLGLDRDA